jgi:hypothetical protein
MWGGAGWRIGRIAFPRRRVRAPQGPGASSHARPGRHRSSNVDLPFRGRARIQAGRSFVPIPPAPGLIDPPWKALCYAFRAFRPRDGVAFGGPLLGASDRQVRISVAAACCAPPPGVHRQLDAPCLEAPAAPRVGRAARCAPECAHALNAVGRAVHGRGIGAGSAAPRSRAGAAPSSVSPVAINAANQTSQTWDE